MKTKLWFCLAIFAAAVMTVNAQSFTLTNIFGGNSDDISEEDFLTFSKEDGDYNTDGAMVSDRLQFDFSSDKLDGRLRLEYQAGALNGRLFGSNGNDDANNSLLRFRGFMRFRPVEYIGFAAGNDFFTKYAVEGSYLAAADDNAKDARMAESGVAVIGDAAGLRLIANFSGDAFADDPDVSDKIKLNFGFDYNVMDIATVGAAFKSVTNDAFSASAYVGLTAVENLILNAGFLYNATDDDFITAPAKTALSLSAGYEFADLGLGLFLDFASALSDEYIDGGDTLSYEDNGIPMLVRGRVAYNVTEKFSLNLDGSFRMMLGWDGIPDMVVYPYLTYSLDNFGDLKAGVRMNINDGDGLASFSIPLAWEYKIAAK